MRSTSTCVSNMCIDGQNTPMHGNEWFEDDACTIVYRWTEQRGSQHGPKDTPVLRFGDDILLCGMRWDRIVQRCQAYDGGGVQQHSAHSGHCRVCLGLCTGIIFDHSMHSMYLVDVINYWGFEIGLRSVTPMLIDR